jgi:MoxR-like ATPase
MMHLRLGYPDKSEEREILRLASRPRGVRVEPVVSAQELLQAREEIRGVHVDARIQDYVVDLLHGTRDPASVGLEELAPLVSLGASPRAGVALQEGARVRAWLHGRSFVLPEDVKALAPDVLRHRILLTYQADARRIGVDEVVARVLSAVRVP